MYKGQFKTHCKRGHPRIPENLDKHRSCKLCAAVLTPAKIERIREYQKAHPEEHARKNRNWAATESGKLSVKRTKLKQYYSLTVEKRNAMLAEQENRCKVCRVLLDGSTKSLTPNVDHDHGCCPGMRTCGKCIRGLLCGRCNVILGLAKDSVIILERAIQYLKETQNGH